MEYPTSDPLLTRNPYHTSAMADLERKQAEINERLAAMRQMGQQVQMQPQMPAAGAPVWDEINKVTSELSDAEYAFLEQNDEFVGSSQALQGLLQREYLRMMRPLVEATPDGKDALDKHLTLIRRLLKTVKDETNKRNELMNEYLTKYSHLSWNDFIARKQGRGVSQQPAQPQPQPQQMQPQAQQMPPQQQQMPLQ